MIGAAFMILLVAACGGGGSSPQETAEPLNAVAEPLRAKRSTDPSPLAHAVSMVNSTTAGNQIFTSIGALADGGYTVGWISERATLLIQEYDSAGANRGVETAVSLDVAAADAVVSARAIAGSAMAVLSDGTVVVAYAISRALPPSSDRGVVSNESGVYFQRFDRTGVQVLAETEVTSRIEVLHRRSNFFTSVSTVALTDGGFVVAWADAAFSTPFGSISGLFLQRYDSQGQAAGSIVAVGSFPDLAYRIVPDAEGGYVLSPSFLDASYSRLYSVIHYDADQTARQIVAPRTSAALLFPLQDGYVLFASDSLGAFRQLLDSNGQPVGGQMRIASVPVAAEELADGSYVAFWAAGGTLGAQRFSRRSAALGDVVIIETGGSLPGVAALAEGGFALAWSAASASADLDVLTQRFTIQHDNSKKTCVKSAKGLKGQARKAFVTACLR